MLREFDSESVEAVIALVVAAGSAGAVVGYAAAINPELVVDYGGLALSGGLSAILVGQLTRWLVTAGEIPMIGMRLDAPDNATTGFYGVSLAVMLLGLLVEITAGLVNPQFLVLFAVGGAFFFHRGFRRGVRDTSGTS
jgi:hypothetical protein